MKILYVTTIGKTMRFFESFIKVLLDEGHQVELAANETNSPVPECYREWGCSFHHIDFSRSPLSFDNVKAYRQLKKLVENGGYDIVHCHTPNASVVTRLICRKLRKKTGLKVYYTAHGFHFCKGAPKRNWLLFYPVEKLCSRFTDKLITINQDDYILAKTRFRAGEVCYVPGVGIDLSRFEDVQVDRNAKRQELGIPDDAFLMLSVGELNKNKNHQIILKAMARLNDRDIHYAVAGVGNKQDHLLELAGELGISEQVHLLGYRTDIPELDRVADVFCFPSIREGLGLAAIEAMASGLPLITSDGRGVNDYSADGITGYACAPNDTAGFAQAIRRLKDNLVLGAEMGKKNIQLARKYDVHAINCSLKQVYGL